MATRSTIAIAREDGTVAQVYCHWDGYLENNGRLLELYYNTPEKIEELLSHGSISSLGEQVGVEHPFSAHDGNVSYDEHERLYGKMTTYYGRDRGEKDTQARVYANVESYEKDGDNGTFEEFNYLWIGGAWYYKSYDGKVRDVKSNLTVALLKAA